MQSSNENKAEVQRHGLTNKLLILFADSKLGQKDIAILRTKAQIAIIKPSHVIQPVIQKLVNYENSCAVC
jgi:hypothetical protein